MILILSKGCQIKEANRIELGVWRGKWFPSWSFPLYAKS